MRKTLTTLILALATLATASTLRGTPDGGRCVYANTVRTEVIPVDGACPDVTVLRLTEVIPHDSAGTFTGLRCTYEQHPKVPIGADLPECFDAVLMLGGVTVAAIYFHDGHDMASFYGSPCDIFDQHLEHNRASLRQFPKYNRQLNYRLGFPWAEIRERCRNQRR